jgi:nucleoid-associated protein Lsr2
MEGDMAREVIERYVDDLDGSPDAQTIRLSLDGVIVDIDLGPKNEARLRDLLQPYIDNGTKIRSEPGAKRGARTGARRDSGKERNQLIRQWALDNGVELPSRGRIANGVQAAFDDDNVPLLYETVGLEMEAEETQEATPKRSRRKAPSAEFSEAA